MDDLLDEETGLFGFSLVLESYESSEKFSNDSFEDKDDEESGKGYIEFCAVWKRYFSFACSITNFAACLSSGFCCSLFI